MKRIVQLAVVAFLLPSQVAHASIFDVLAGWFPSILKSEIEAAVPSNGDRVNRIAHATKGADFVISTFDNDIIARFTEAWQRSGNGTTNTESVVLIQRMVGDRFTAKVFSTTNEYKCFTFNWHPATIAIVHTHPNSSPPKPQDEDIKAADKFGVPIFTLTLRGMFVYDPTTKKTSKVLDGLEWTHPAAWTKVKAQLAH